MGFGTFSANGFSVVGSNALDLIATAQAAGSGMVSANIQQLGSRLGADIAGVNRTIFAQTEKIASINTAGFNSLGNTMSEGFSSLQAISGASLAVQAVGFAVVAQQLHSLGGDVRKMHADLSEQGEKLLGLQRVANERLESLVQFASRTLETQERILETLVSSKTIEAQQFVRQGWDNLVNGYEDEAFLRFQRSLEYDNTVYLAHAELARILERRSDDAAAEAHFRKATRFASTGGPKMRAFAHIQLAGFFERRSRLSDAVTEVGAALHLDGVDKQTVGGWHLYQSELFARIGDGERAIDSLRSAVESDDAFFLAVMGSETLQSAIPTLAAILVELDHARRSSVLQRLEKVAEILDQLDVLGSAAAAPLRNRGAKLLEQALLARFDELNAKHAEAVALQEVCERSFEDHVKNAVRELEGRRRSISATLERARTLKASPQEKEASLIVAAIIVGAFLLVFLTAGFGFFLLAPVGAAAMAFFLKPREESKRKAAEAAQLQGADAEAAALNEMEDFEHARRAVEAKLSSVSIGTPHVAAALELVKSLAPPPLPEIAERACPNCGGVVKAAAKKCKHCKGDLASTRASVPKIAHHGISNAMFAAWIVIIIGLLPWAGIGILLILHLLGVLI